jgi:hypothetical protein
VADSNINLVALTASVGGSVFMWSASHLEVSDDYGASFKDRTPPGGGDLIAATPLAGNDALPRVLVERHQPNLPAVLLRSSDAGQHWGAGAPLAGGGLLLEMLQLTDGDLLAGRAASQFRSGIVCSANGGYSWAPLC